MSYSSETQTNPSFSSTRSNFGSQDEYNTSSTASNVDSSTNSSTYNQGTTRSDFGSRDEYNNNTSSTTSNVDSFNNSPSYNQGPARSNLGSRDEYNTSSATSNLDSSPSYNQGPARSNLGSRDEYNTSSTTSNIDSSNNSPSYNQGTARSNLGSRDEYNTSSSTSNVDSSNNSSSYNQDRDQYSQNDNTSAPSSQDQDYPEQRHAGAVGYGPQYRSGPSVGEKLTGFKEELKGKITKNEDLVEQGRERRTGELKRRQEQEELENNDPFKEPGEDKQSSTPSATSTSEPKSSSAFGSTNTSAPPQPEYSTQRDARGQEIAAESGSGMAKPRDVKMIDETREQRRGDSMEGREPGDIAREVVDSA